MEEKTSRGIIYICKAKQKVKQSQAPTRQELKRFFYSPPSFEGSMKSHTLTVPSEEVDANTAFS